MGYRKSLHGPVGRAGFTLLELLVAVLLTTILAGAVAASFSGGLRVWERSDSYGRSEQAALFIMERLGRDIANAVAVGEEAFEGGADQAVFVTQVEAYAGPSPGPLERVFYAVLPGASGVVVRRASRWPTGAGGDVDERLGDGGVALAFAYASALRGGEPSGWVDRWRSETNLPHAVRVVLTSEEGEPLERTFMPGSISGVAPPDDGVGR